jgi:hypothetical protein
MPTNGEQTGQVISFVRWNFERFAIPRVSLFRQLFDPDKRVPVAHRSHFTSLGLSR